MLLLPFNIITFKNFVNHSESLCQMGGNMTRQRNSCCEAVPRFSFSQMIQVLFLIQCNDSKMDLMNFQVIMFQVWNNPCTGAYQIKSAKIRIITRWQPKLQVQGHVVNYQWPKRRLPFPSSLLQVVFILTFSNHMINSNVLCLNNLDFAPTKTCFKLWNATKKNLCLLFL